MPGRDLLACISQHIKRYTRSINTIERHRDLLNSPNRSPVSFQLVQVALQFVTLQQQPIMSPRRQLRLRKIILNPHQRLSRQNNADASHRVYHRIHQLAHPGMLSRSLLL